MQALFGTLSGCFHPPTAARMWLFTTLQQVLVLTASSPAPQNSHPQAPHQSPAGHMQPAHADEDGYTCGANLSCDPVWKRCMQSPRKVGGVTCAAG